MVWMTLSLDPLFKDGHKTRITTHCNSGNIYLAVLPRRNLTVSLKKFDEMLAKLQEPQKKDVEMWNILREIFTYCFFLWIFLTLSYGNRTFTTPSSMRSTWMTQISQRMDTTVHSRL
ncbi:hypothetical protein Pcinc_043472 [Petrolisthes cinctipes]|uniref:Uncharacterized protein n=1 Tax=Petrolisthes cinctipes TaxID=88211 RepID=A0AAE1BGH4_PETCI|nr:hypothetical protein Pcinc_043472 [Petrolisthes cinctipes]